MTRPNAQTQIKNPMTDRTDEGLRIENALLYRRLILLETTVIKCYAALEMATGEAWDTTDLRSLDNDGLRDVVAQNIAAALNIPLEAARKRVRHNESMAVSSTMKTAPDQG